MGPVRLKYATSQAFSPGGGVSVSYTFLQAKVKNIAFSKDVVVHLRHYDSTWTDEPLAWVANYGDYGVFQRSASNADEFVVRYTVAGQTFWDNNDGANYHLSTFRNVTGGNVMLNTATARRGSRAGGGFTFTTSWFEGEIYVNNLSFAKEVGVRYSADEGQTWSDSLGSYAGAALEATYATTTGVEVWKFKTPELNLNNASDRFRFAVFYRIPGSGTTFWDNNFSQDYTLSKADGTNIK